MSLPVDSMAALLVELEYLHERNIPVDARVSEGHLSTLTYRSPQDVEVCMYFDPDELGDFF